MFVNGRLSRAADAMQIRTWIGKFHQSPTAVQDLPPTARKAHADVRIQTSPFFVSCLCVFAVCFLRSCLSCLGFASSDTFTF